MGLIAYIGNNTNGTGTTAVSGYTAGIFVVALAVAIIGGLLTNAISLGKSFMLSVVSPYFDSSFLGLAEGLRLDGPFSMESK